MSHATIYLSDEQIKTVMKCLAARTSQQDKTDEPAHPNTLFDMFATVSNEMKQPEHDENLVHRFVF